MYIYKYKSYNQDPNPNPQKMNNYQQFNNFNQPKPMTSYNNFDNMNKNNMMDNRIMNTNVNYNQQMSQVNNIKPMPLQIVNQKPKLNPLTMSVEDIGDFIFEYCEKIYPKYFLFNKI